MFELSDKFYRDLGLIEMPEELWAHSMITKPSNKKVVCHASAWDFFNKKDFRFYYSNILWILRFFIQTNC
jgi:peptidyl-dipeptidase A